MPTTTQPSPGMKFITVPKVENGITTEVQIEVPDVAGPSWGPKDKHRLLNTRLLRADGPAKTTGTAEYTHDIRLPGMLFGRMLLSPHAHARITSIDLTAAQAIPGVQAVMAVPAPTNELRYEGQPVAAVAAVTPELADDAIRAIAVQYEVLPHVVTADDAMKPDAAKVFPNPPPLQKRGDPAAVEAAFSDCDEIVDVEYRTVIMHHACLETHSVVCDYRGGDSATIYCSTQNCSGISAFGARELGLDVSKVVGIVRYMGGGFGSKFDAGIVGMWACRLSKLTSLPVKMVFTRREEFLASGNGPGSVQKVKAGVKKDGTLYAIQATQHQLAGLGRGGVQGLPYQYVATHAYNEASPLVTNEDSSVAMRAPGHPQTCYVMESLMDELAEKIDMDPIAFRKVNLPKNDSGTAWSRQLDRGAQEIGWDKRNPKAGSDAGPLKRGFGCAIGAWGGSGSPGCDVEVKINQDGTVTASVGSQDLGTGTRTYLRAIVAEEFGLDPEDVHEFIGDTRLGKGTSSGGSTTAASLAPAAKVAAFDAKNKMAAIVAPLLGADPSAVLFDNHQIAGNGKSLTWQQACAALPATGISTHGAWRDGLSGTRNTGGAHGASFAEVEVDVETGHCRVVKMAHVQDGGLILNRLAAESQINGGMIQSTGMALYEGRVMDSDLGVMLNPGFGDYKLAGCLEIGELHPIIDDGDSRNIVIGIAEPANIPGAGAIANAVYNACGVRVRQLPITPDKILNGLNKIA